MKVVRNRDLRSRITLFAALMLLAVVVLSAFYFISFASLIFSNNEAHFQRRAQDECNIVGMRLGDIRKQMKWLSTDMSSASYFNSQSEWNKSVYARAIKNNLQGVLTALEPVDAVILSMADGNVTFEGHGMEETAFLSVMRQIRAARRNYRSFPFLCEQGDKRFMIMSEPLTAFDEKDMRQMEIAQIYFVVNVSALLPAYEESGGFGALLWNSDTDTCVSAVSDEERARELLENRQFDPARTQVASVRLSDGKYMYQSFSVGEPSWTFVTASPEHSLAGGGAILAVGLALILLILVLAASAVASINRGITQPLRGITQGMERIRGGDYHHRLPESGTNELSEVARGVNRLLDELHSRTEKMIQTQEKLYDAEILRKDSELMALRCQINPHFLYNTLECVRSIAWSYRAGEVTEIVGAMIGIFRYCTAPEGVVRVRDELDCCRNYGEIIRIRFQGKYRVVVPDGGEAEQMRISKMVLQPIVENAVTHGLEERTGEGEVRISCSMTEDEVLIQVSDNGAGMTEEELAALRQRLSGAEQAQRKTRGGVGLYNVHRRLQYEYGPGCGLEVTSIKDEGTQVLVRIPRLRAAEEERL